MRPRTLHLLTVPIAALWVLGAASAHAQFPPSPSQLAAMSTASGDGQVSIEVDAYGSFGYRTFGFQWQGSYNLGDALFDPLGTPAFCPTGLCTTSWESGLFFRAAPPDETWLTIGQISSSAPYQLPDPGFTSTTATSASSTFTHAGLTFDLEQRLEDLDPGSGRIGGLLIQEYTITNPGPATAVFDLVRYYEGDLFGTVADGGGHLIQPSGDEFVFQTDTAGGPSTETTLVATTACGGTVPTDGRWEVSYWTEMGIRIGAGGALKDLVYGDTNSDEWADFSYDVGTAIANEFELASGESVLYVTTTLFGTIAPDLALRGCEEVIGGDADGDGVPDNLDVCADTVIPEGVPTVRLGVNRWALVDEDTTFDTTLPEGEGPGLSFTVGDTAGCSCEQIIEALELGKGHRKFGCSISAMEDWIALVNPSVSAALSRRFGAGPSDAMERREERRLRRAERRMERRLRRHGWRPVDRDDPGRHDRLRRHGPDRGAVGGPSLDGDGHPNWGRRGAQGSRIRGHQ